MENSNLISLLKTFTKKEMKQFDKFLRSPYFTEGKNIRYKILYEHFSNLKVFYPEFAGGQFEKILFFQKLYHGKKFSDVTLRKLNSDLYKLAEKFLVQLELEKDNFKQREYLLSSLSPRKLDNAFLKKTAECYRFLDSDKFNLYYHYNRQLIDILVNNFSIYRQSLLQNYDLQKEADNFFLSFVSRSLEIYRNMKIDEGILNIKYVPHFIGEVSAYIEKHPEFLKENPLIAIHYYELMVILNKNSSDYQNLKILKDIYADKLDFFGRYNLYTNLYGYCIEMIKLGRVDYRRELLDINIEMMEKNVLSSSDYISYSQLIVMTRNASRLKEFGWSMKFLNEYKDKLDPKHKDYAVNYSMAEMYYEQKKYDEALKYLSGTTIEFSSEKMQVKNMMLKIYYDTDSIENIFSLVDSCRHFLKSDRKLIENRKKLFIQFLNFVSQLIDIKLKPDPAKLSIMKKDLDKSGYFANKDWLIEKIAEFDNPNKKRTLQKS